MKKLLFSSLFRPERHEWMIQHEEKRTIKERKRHLLVQSVVMERNKT
jgi:hypothetical protein